MNDREVTILLNLVSDIGPVRFQKLKDYFGGVSDIFQGDVRSFSAIEGIGENVASSIYNGLRQRDYLDKEFERCAKLGVQIITQADTVYPTFLRELVDAPMALYYKGDAELLNAASLALVGSRRPTAYGERVAAMLSKECAQVGIPTVSGLARGIDTVVHQSTIAAKGRTIAVLGSGLDDIYPPENKKLAEQISSNGLLLSEFKLDTFPEPGNFPRRNRIVAALSLGTIVVEADEKSGALITARLAAEQGKDIFAVPGQIDNKMSRGPHRLLRDGAKLVEKLQDVIEEIAPLSEHYLTLSKDQSKVAVQQAKKLIQSLNIQEQSLYNLTGSESVSAEVLLAQSHLTAGEFSQVLLSLEMKGLVQSLPGKRYGRC